MKKIILFFIILFTISVIDAHSADWLRKHKAVRCTFDYNFWSKQTNREKGEYIKSCIRDFRVEYPGCKYYKTLYEVINNKYILYVKCIDKERSDDQGEENNYLTF